jgi:hypothetical protein
MRTGDRRRHLRRAAAAALLLAPVVAAACLERGDRLVPVEERPSAAMCEPGAALCQGDVLTRCDGGGHALREEEDCAASGRVCAQALGRCAACRPGLSVCEDGAVSRCRDDGAGRELERRCDAPGTACRGGSCRDLCALAAEERSNVGCLYWAVDLDNAALGPTRDAAAQQYAVVVSNPQPDVRATVRVLQDDAAPGEESRPVEVASATVPPLDLRVFKLGPREVDGSTPGARNDGTHTALTRAAYRIESDVPVVAYQFNPLENVDVFSNDASLLVPVEALGDPGGALETTYVVASWPQTIAITDDPDTNFDPADPTALRAFLTLVGTREATRVRVTTTARIVPGGPVPATPVGGVVEAELGPFEVLNLETDDFDADFTGSIVESDGPVAVFVGSEASDAPRFERLADRDCCADHLEEQLAPTRTAGKTFAVPHSPSRTRAVRDAGVPIAVVPEPDFVRFVATTEAGARIATTLPPLHDRIDLAGIGASAEVRAEEPFRAESTEPILVAHVMAGQDAAGVAGRLPGGDPSLMFVPPLEQARADYVFLTPDKYAFDFIGVAAPEGETPSLDGVDLPAQGCERTEIAAPADGPPLWFWSCQLGFPIVDDAADPAVVDPGEQNDGVHRVTASVPVAVVVWGFDSFVSYAYAAGTQLREIAPPR